MKLLRGLAALALIAAILAGLPWLLLRYGHWPIRTMPTVEWIKSLKDTYVSDSGIVDVLTVAAWAVWAIWSWSILAELAAAIRGIQPPQIHFAGPLQTAAHGLVATLVLSVSLNHGTPNADAVTAAGVVRQPVATQTVKTSSLAAAAGRTGLTGPSVRTIAARRDVPAIVTVDEGDNAWSIAEAYLGDGMRWRELWNLNHQRIQADGQTWTDQELLEPGWQLHMPPTDITPTNGTVGTARTITYTVVPGDNLSKIADDALGDETRYPEIFRLSQPTTQPDGRHLTNPDLILPGWKLTIPTNPAATPTPTPTLTATPTAEPPTAPTAPPTTAVALPPPTMPTTTTIAPPTIAPASPAVPETTAATTTTTAAAPTSPPALRPSQREPSAELKLAVAGSVALATALAIRVAFWRRKRMARGGQYVRQIETRANDMRTIVRAGDVPLVRWAGQEIAQLIERLDRRQLTGGPLAVELSTEAGIEILWETPQQPAPESWKIRDGGTAWQLSYNPDNEIPEDRLTSGIPGLVTVGTRQGRHLLLDLEAFGTTSVTGPPHLVDAFLTSVALELATSEDLSDTYTRLVGIDLPGGPHHRTKTVTASEAITHLTGWRTTALAAMARDGLTDTFLARAGDDSPIETYAVVATGDAFTHEQITNLAPARSGVALIIGRATTHATCTITIHPDGTARVEPLGITIVAAGVDRDAAEAIDAVFNELRNLAATTDASPPTEALDDETADTDDPPELKPASQDNTSVRSWPYPLAESDVSDPVPPPNRDETNESRVLPDILTSPAGHDDSDGYRPTSDVRDDDDPAAGCDDEVGSEETGQLPLDGICDNEQPPTVESILVRVLGVPSVRERPELNRKEILITAYLALGNPRSSTSIRDAGWNGDPVEIKTFRNVIASLRNRLGMFSDGQLVLDNAVRNKQQLQLDPRVSTDLALLRTAVQEARTASTSEATLLLAAAFRHVDGVPFDGNGYDWAHTEQHVSEANTLIETAAVQLATLLAEDSQIDQAREVIRRALRSLQATESLYLCRMRIEHNAHNPTGIAKAFKDLTEALADYSLDPSTQARELARSLGIR